MMIKIYSQNPNQKAISQIVDILNNDGVIVYPTDTVYAFGCSIKSVKAIERLKSIRGAKKGEMAIVCADISNISSYAKLDTPTFKLLKRNLPGAFTFILEASGKIPDKFLEKRKDVGVRIPKNSITLAIVEALGCPLVTTSVRDDTEVVEYTTDPELINEKYGDLVDCVVDGGIGESEGSTIVDCTKESIEILRQGVGELLR